MKFAINDICVSAPGYRPAVFLITAIDPSRPKNAYNGINLVNKKSYRLSDETLVKVGTGIQSADAVQGVLPTAAELGNQKFAAGRRHAQRMMMYANGPDRLQWDKLSKLEENESIQIRHRGGLTQARFKYVLEKGQTYAFVAENANGTSYKYRLSDLYSDVIMGRKKRSEAEILEDLRGVHCALSPENLTGDGELPRSIVMRRKRALDQQLVALERELGRPATNKEIYGRDF